MNSRMLLIGGLVVLIVLGAGAFLLFSNNSTNQTQETSLPAENSQTQEPTTEAQTEKTETTNVTLSASGFSAKNITVK